MIKKSIVGGLFIALVQLLYVSLMSKNVYFIFPAILFSMGLICILITNSSLYTGQIGYIRSYKQLPNLLLVLLFNFIGCLILLFYPKPDYSIDSFLLRMSAPIYVILIRAIFCGVFIYLAVYFWKKSIFWLTVFFVTSFIVCGAEHCVADFAFICLMKVVPSLEMLIFLLIVIIGNSIGSIIMNQLMSEKIRRKI